jgi:RNA polymerase sigma-70 factor (ECF subfamily)
VLTGINAAVMKADTPTDNELVRLISGGDREAFAELYRRRQANVYRFALQMSGRPALAEDVTQEVFMILMRGDAGYDEARGTVKAFLLGVARNYVLRRLKQERHFVSVEENENISNGEAGGHLATLTLNETIESVRKAVLSLPEHYREVIVLCELQEMSYGETAQVLGCAIGTVRSRLHRARAMLLEKLHPARDENATAAEVKSARCFA